MKPQVHEFNVEMTCGGCAKSITNVLNKEQGVTNVEVDLQTDKVFVTCTLSSDEILQILKKTGKSCQYLGSKDT